MRHAAPLAAVLLALAALAPVKIAKPVTERPTPAAEQDGVAVYFSPKGGCADTVAFHVGRATKTLDVATYSITHLTIAKAVKDAHERGVKVRVVMDKAQAAGRYSSATYLANAGVPVRIDAAAGLMHNKFAVIDGETILTGSFNWTTGADEDNAENLLVITGKPALVAAYQAAYEKVLAKSKPYERPR